MIKNKLPVVPGLYIRVSGFSLSACLAPVSRTNGGLGVCGEIKSRITPLIPRRLALLLASSRHLIDLLRCLGIKVNERVREKEKKEGRNKYMKRERERHEERERERAKRRVRRVERKKDFYWQLQCQ